MSTFTSSSCNHLVPATNGKRNAEEDKEYNNRAKKQWQQGNKKFPRLPGDDGDMDAYNRECYKYLYSFILEDKQFKQYLINGNPVIGKTFFGKLMLIMLLKKDKKVLLDYETVTKKGPSGS
ncbi:hypothetical protein RhiirA5_433251 [Rhizophagus irregularis]|uniref:Uncharacterized protein n=1 Tax=Rhizophagus irregularis TaxID=588596 RepID=A0A2I1FG14_9GLOM|nr:hypothetical protein RhiirA5_433251 [Rhizophagus irregularis]PKY33313.1 hypothetical protein RhiirB3_452103 [Rhizophagus irregularis]